MLSIGPQPTGPGQNRTASGTMSSGYRSSHPKAGTFHGGRHSSRIGGFVGGRKSSLRKRCRIGKGILFTSFAGDGICRVVVQTNLHRNDPSNSDYISHLNSEKTQQQEPSSGSEKRVSWDLVEAEEQVNSREDMQWLRRIFSGLDRIRMHSRRRHVK